MKAQVKNCTPVVKYWRAFIYSTNKCKMYRKGFAKRALSYFKISKKTQKIKCINFSFFAIIKVDINL